MRVRVPHAEAQGRAEEAGGSSVKELEQGELFAGIGGFGLAGLLTGIETRWSAEIDPFPRAVLEHRFPEVEHHIDVRDLDGKSLPRVDVLTAGSPCQDFSIAGMRKGLVGDRSGVFAEFIRLVAELRPTYAVWENVAGALNSNKGEDFANVLAAFTGAPGPITLPKHPNGRRSRYAGVARSLDGWVAWRVLDAQNFGVAQRRERIFAVRTEDARCVDVLFGKRGREYVDATPATFGGPGAHYVWLLDEDPPFNTSMAPDQPRTVRLAEVLETEVDEKYYLSPRACLGILKRATRRGRALPWMLHLALWMQAGKPEEYRPPEQPTMDDDPDRRFANGHPVPFDWQASGGANDQSFRGKGRTYVVRRGERAGAVQANKTEAVAVLGSRTHALTHEGHDASEDGTGRGTPIVVNALDASSGGADDNDAQGGRLVPVQDTANAITSHHGRNATEDTLVPELASTLRATHGLQVESTYIPATFRKVHRAHHAEDPETWAEADATNTLTRHDNLSDVRATDLAVAYALEPESGQGADLRARETATSPALTSNWTAKTTDRGVRAMTGYRVRRLTPRECERLQGFYDDWTAVGEAKDSPRYKALGNAVAVPVAAWVLQRIRLVDRQQRIVRGEPMFEPIRRGKR